jgi:hypothetical protein
LHAALTRPCVEVVVAAAAAADAASAAAKSELPRRWWSEAGPGTLRRTGRLRNQTARPAAVGARTTEASARTERLPILSFGWRWGEAGSADERARSIETTTPPVAMVVATLPFVVRLLTRYVPFESYPFGRRRLCPPCFPFATAPSSSNNGPLNFDLEVCTSSLGSRLHWSRLHRGLGVWLDGYWRAKNESTRFTSRNLRGTLPSAGRA